MKTKLFLIKLIIPVFILSSISMTGCSGQKNQNQEPKPQSMASEQQGDKIPEQLTGIESNIEAIFTELKGPSAEVETEKGKKEDTGNKEGGQTSEGQKGDQASDEKSGGSQEGGQGGGEQKKQDKQKGQSSQQSTAQQKEDPWAKISPIVNNLHYQWNSYMPMAAQKGANKALMDNFSKALNSLTNTIIGKNSTNTLMATSYLYAYIPDFYSLYKTETSPEIKRIKYYTRNAMLNSWTANWTQADYDINTLKSSWPIVKNTISKDQQDNCNKLDYSLYELEKVIKEKNQPLIDIKGRVALSNIMSIEKGMQEGNKKGGGQAGGGESGGGGSSESQSGGGGTS